MLDTSAMSFYGFYGFYGVSTGPDLVCEVVSVQFNLYNYGAQDLTYVSTIQYIIDQTRAAIDMSYLQAVPTGSTNDYRVEVTELSGSEVTYVKVIADVTFIHSPAGNTYSRSKELGGAFGKFLGLTEAEASPDTGVAPVPTSGVFSIGLDLIVDGFSQEILADANQQAAFEASLTSAFQTAVLTEYGSSSAAEGISVEMFGITDEGASEGAPAVAVRLYLHFASNAEVAMQFLSALNADPYQFGNKFGVLSETIKVVEAVDVTSDVMDAAASRKLLQNGAVRDTSFVTNHLVTSLAASGLGVASINEGSISCKNSLVSSFYGFYGVESAMPAEGTSMSVTPELRGGGSSIVAAGGSSVVADGSSAVDFVSSAEFYGTTSFYGTSFYGTSFYGTSFYGEDSSATAAAASSGAAAASSAGGMSFYGYSPVAPSPGPSSPSRPESPSSGTPPPVAPTDYPVFFTTILSDYDMSDLTGPDMEAFRQDYTAAVENAIRLLGITSDPEVEIISVRDGSVAVDTKVNFMDDRSGAELLQQVLAMNPSLAFPAFSSLGSITITDVGVTAPSGQAESREPVERESPVATECEQMDRYGDCCATTLDAKLECCATADVDECGVCGGDGSSCALAALVRISTPARPGLDDPSSAAFQAAVADFKEGMATLFSNFNIDPLRHVEVDASAVTSNTNANGAFVMDIPFRMYPDRTAGVTVPTVPRATAILTNAANIQMTHKDLTLLEVLDVSRRGVCDNGVCEIGEMLPVSGSLPEDLCAADCPGVISCPVGSATDLVGERYSSCTGNGACVQSTGECRCSVGYAGANCGQCAVGFAAQSGKCVSTAPTVVPGTEPGSGTEPVEALSKEGESDNTQRDIILGVVFGVIALILVSLGLYWMLVLRKRRAGAREEGLAFSSQQQVPASNEEPDIPTRQAAENTV
jgi:hypothetical protein